MMPLMPLRPAPAPTNDPPASRRATLILNLGLVTVAAVVVLSNLLFFPLGPGRGLRVVDEKPAVSAPVIVALPAPRQTPDRSESAAERRSVPPLATPAIPPVAPHEAAGAGAEDPALLPRIEPSAAPPARPAAEPVPPPPPQIVASLPPPTESVPPPQIVASLPPPTESVPDPPAVAPVETAAASPESPPLQPAEIEALTRRGEALLMTGDIIAARYAFERAARAGSGAAATGVGKTFDPLFLAAAGVRGIQGNPSKAIAWYRRGSAAGDQEAEFRLRALRLQLPE